MTRRRGFYIDAVVKGYFGAMDPGDVEATVACFALDATLITNDVVLTEHDALRSFSESFAEAPVRWCIKPPTSSSKPKRKPV